MDKSVCFVCGKEFPREAMEMNDAVYLPVCSACKHTDNEKKKVDEFLDSLAEGFVCGCI